MLVEGPKSCLKTSLNFGLLISNDRILIFTEINFHWIHRKKPFYSNVGFDTNIDFIHFLALSIFEVYNRIPLQYFWENHNLVIQ